ncbi:hypothetical protein [Rhizobium etli]|nr:hypothetical protein [Rhizobium etli]
MAKGLRMIIEHQSATTSFLKSALSADMEPAEQIETHIPHIFSQVIGPTLRPLQASIGVKTITLEFEVENRNHLGADHQ